MDGKPVESRRSPACCKSQNACPANWLASAEMGGDSAFKTPCSTGRGFF